MSKFSVKKPITVFVVVIVIIALGIVSTLRMTPDLLPSIDLPYVVVLTTYPGATPEEVETTVTKPLEQSLATLENLASISSVSDNNYSLIMLEFESKANMDTAVVNTLQSVDLVEGYWDDMVGAPTILKLNPTMMPITIAAVDMEGMDTQELSTFVEDTLMNKLEGTTGVASISTGGLIESQINVVLSEEKIEDLNQTLINKASAELADARAQINSGLQQLNQAEKQLKESKEELDQTKEETYDELAKVSAQLDAAMAQASAYATQIASLEAVADGIIAQIEEGLYIGGEGYEEGSEGAELITMTLEQLQAQLNEVNAKLDGLRSASDEADATVAMLQDAYEQAERGSYTAMESFDAAYAQLDQAANQISSQKAQLNSAMAQVNAASNSALLTEGLSTMLSTDLISGVLQGQNFSMPAGYVQEGNIRYLVSVGDKLENQEELEGLFLFNIEGLGDITLSDVADVFVTDNSDAVYGSVNGNAAVMLTFSKQSNYPTATVSNNISDKFAELSAEYEGLTFSTLMDQGDYIYLIIGAIASSLGWGALFAILVLIIFLRDLKPTFITLVSIPISIIFALMLMYFSGVTLNMISLSGLAVAVGMLVDNSIVVIENIYRLRREGVPAAKAAVAGAKQVSAAIISSTLTTVCVFTPIVFVDGLTRQLFTDMALTIGYSLVASLIIALTLVPALASIMMKKEPKPETKGFTKVRNGYRKLAGWNLRHKFLILLLTVGLLGFSVYATVSKGFIFLPEMSTPQISGSLTMHDEEADIDETSEVADQALALMEQVDGVKTAGAMLSSSSMGILTGETSSTTVSLYLILDEETTRNGAEIEEDIHKLCEDLPCDIEILTSSSLTTYTSALGGEGVTIDVFSTDNEQLQIAAVEIGKLLEEVEGIESVDNGLADAQPEFHFAVDKQKAMEKGLTVAQVYLQVSDALTTETNATTIRMEDGEYDVIVGSGEDTITPQELKDLILEGTDMEGNTVTVKLSDIAEVEITESLPSISRLNQKTYLGVSGTVSEGYNVTLVTEAAEAKLSEYELPSGVSYEFAGENEMIMEAMEDLLLMMALGILLVYLIMVAQFQSMRSPFVVMFTIPLAFTGGLLALLIFDMEISVIAMIGFIMLVGIIVNNGIVLVDYINQLRATGMAKKDAILEAGATRMRPVLMTSLTTVLGLVVMAVGKTAGTDLMQPVALVSIGGLVYATVMTLFVVPVMYDLLNGEEYKILKKEDLDVSDLIVE